MKKASVLLALSSLVLAVPALAQGPWSLELRGGAALPTADLGESELDTGYGFELTGAYRFMPHLEAYAGWDWMHFATSGDAPNQDVEETGYALGLRFLHPIGQGRFSWFARAGATINHLEVEDSGGEIVADSKHGLGWECGLGAGIAFDPAWLITPGVRYRSTTRDLDSSGESTSVSLRYLAVEVGVTRRF